MCCRLSRSRSRCCKAFRLCFCLLSASFSGLHPCQSHLLFVVWRCQHLRCFLFWEWSWALARCVRFPLWRWRSPEYWIAGLSGCLNVFGSPASTFLVSFCLRTCSSVQAQTWTILYNGTPCLDQPFFLLWPPPRTCWMCILNLVKASLRASRMASFERAVSFVPRKIWFDPFDPKLWSKSQRSVDSSLN